MHSVSSPSQWLAELAKAGTRQEIDLHGAPALYTARPGWIVRPRPFPQHLVYVLIKGCFTVCIEGRDLTLEVGDVLWLQPGTAFACHLPGIQPVTFFRFRLSARDARGRCVAFRRAPRRFRGCEAARRWVEEIVRPAQGALQSWRLRGALLGFFAELLAPKSAASAKGRLTRSQQEAVTSALDGEPAAWPSPARLAAELRLTPDYFARRFRRTFGLSPRAWLVRERIRRAALRLRESQLGIGEVADEFGYRDIFFFSRQFKQVMGQTPTSYRRDV